MCYGSQQPSDDPQALSAYPQGFANLQPAHLFVNVGTPFAISHGTQPLQITQPFADP